MTLVRYLMEGGTHGNNATTGDSQATFLSTAGGTIAYSNARGKNGLGMNFISNTAGQCVGRWAASAASTTMSFRAWFWGPGSTPASILGICNFHSAPGAVAVRVQWNTANALVFSPVTGSTVTIATGLDPALQYDLSVQIVVGTTGSVTGTLRSTAGTQVGTVNSNSFNSNTAAINEVAVGILGTYAASYTMGWDEISLDDGSTSEIALYSTSPAGAGADLVWDGSQWR